MNKIASSLISALTFFFAAAAFAQTNTATPSTNRFVMRFTASRLTRLPSELKTRLASGNYRQAAVGACPSLSNSPFTTYNIAVLLYR